MSRTIRTKPVPFCPECGAQMKLRTPNSWEEWESFWGCSRYPKCKGSRGILSNGRPDMDDDEEAWAVFLDDE
jgi:ssDNA-binding Zn-finger/Zn-ribbon topoisomerase 1